MAFDKFKDRLRQARVDAGLSQTDLGVRCGIAPTQISRYEAGRAVPRPHIRARLAKELGVDPSVLEEDALEEFARPQHGDVVTVQLHMPVDMHSHYVDMAGQSRRDLSSQILSSLDELQSLRDRVDSLENQLERTRQQGAMPVSVELRRLLEDAAQASRRTLLAEVVARLDASFNTREVEDLKLKISNLEGKLSGTAFVVDAVLRHATERLKEMADTQKDFEGNARDLHDAFHDMMMLADRHMNGEVRDRKLDLAIFAELKGQASTAWSELDHLDAPDTEITVKEAIDAAQEQGRVPPPSLFQPKP